MPNLLSVLSVGKCRSKHHASQCVCRASWKVEMPCSSYLHEEIIIFNFDLIAVQRPGWWASQYISRLVIDPIVAGTEELLAFLNPAYPAGKVGAYMRHDRVIAPIFGIGIHHELFLIRNPSRLALNFQRKQCGNPRRNF